MKFRDDKTLYGGNINRTTNFLSLSKLRCGLQEFHSRWFWPFPTSKTLTFRTSVIAKPFWSKWDLFALEWKTSHLASLWNKGSDGATWKWLAWHFTQVGIIARGRGGGGGYSWEFLVGLCRLVHQILTLFQTKTCHFPNPFSDLMQWPLKSMPVFRPKGPKTIPFGAAHNYIAYIREYPPGNNRNF